MTDPRDAGPPADPRYAPPYPPAPYPPGAYPQPGYPPPSASYPESGTVQPAGGGYPASPGSDSDSSSPASSSSSSSSSTEAGGTDRPAVTIPQPKPGLDDKGHVRRTRVSIVWVGLIAAAVFLILLVVFIAQNVNNVPLHFLGFSGEVSLGLALLIAAVAGLLIAAVPGSIRIWQLRRALKRNVRLVDEVSRSS